MGVQYLSRIMLIYMRDFIIRQKWIFKQAVKAYANALPEPTKENTLEPNSPIIIDIEDKFFKYYDFKGNKPLFEAMWKILICEYEHDPHYRDICQWVLEELVEAVMDGRWTPRPHHHPSGHWKEPRETCGEYDGRRFKDLIKKTPN